MSVTTLPYMDAVEQTDSVREGWYKLECQLCEFETFAGAFHVCEDEAADHLDECHPRKRKLADDEMRARRAQLISRRTTN
ncbi:hypothetical protein [Arthrobacter sp. 18067]|uniref:hypothetical protein n=1 Tax=Arthrobacter sp. 18067 TaxID=2681413 RepID=UPI001357C436|nr:hypothetical protein [Arthrobacter sp. 18067]